MERGDWEVEYFLLLYHLILLHLLLISVPSEHILCRKDIFPLKKEHIFSLVFFVIVSKKIYQDNQLAFLSKTQCLT